MAPSRTVTELAAGADFSGELSGLEETLNGIMLNELRIWLLRSLMSKCLVTRDILYFAMNQADLRISNKKLDNVTMKHAMLSKIRDAKQTLKTQRWNPLILLCFPETLFRLRKRQRSSSLERLLPLTTETCLGLPR